MQCISIMAGVLERLSWPRKKTVHHSDLKAMELEAAREILAEVFRVSPSEVNEMIDNRLEKVPSIEACCEEDGLWPMELWMEG